MHIRTMAFTFAISILLSACKKDRPDVMANEPAPAPSPLPASGDVLKDSIGFRTMDIYLWNAQLPASFNARDYTDPIAIMEAIRTYSIEPGFTQPVDRFSFAIKKEEWDNLSTGMSSAGSAVAVNGDIGLTVFFRSEGDLRVRLVEPNSPAGIAGIHRGWRIIKINGNTNITTGNASFITDNIYNSSNVNISFRKPDGGIVDISLSQSHYATKPVYLDTVYNVSNKKIGYLVFNSFLGKLDQLYGDLHRVFSRFEGEGVEDVVIDLRYNGGGYVSVQEKMANYLINTAANGNVMMKQVYNSNNSSSNETTKFSKLGSLNLSRLYFIVGRATASASELLINNLKPYMNVKLIGGTTYGKPVGFFPIAVGDWYIFPVSFRTLNKNGEGNYFNGITVDKIVADGLDKEWGDLSESSLASAVNNITSGSFRVPGQQTYIEPAAVATGNSLLEAPLLKLTIGSTPK